MVEALEGERAVISRGEGGGAVGDSPVAVEPALELADDRRPAGDGVEKCGEGRRRLVRSLDPNFGDLGRAQGGKRARRVGQAVQRFVMKNNRFAVGAQLDVAFDREAAGDRRLGRPKRIFDHALGFVMQAAMGDRTLDEPGRGVDWPHTLISKTASTSASALSGRWATPIVVRAWRPLLSKQFNDEVGRAVHRLTKGVKARLDVEEPAQPHDLLHLVEIAERRLQPEPAR